MSTSAVHPRDGSAGLEGWIRSHPFASFYVVALAFSTSLWCYLVVMEVLAPNLYGQGVGVFARFQANMAGLQASAPLLMQHRDSIIVYLTLYAMLPLAAPFFFFPFGPTASALIVTGLARGKTVVMALLGAYRPVRGGIGWRCALRLYGVLGLLLVSLTAGTMLYDAQFHGGQRLEQMVRFWGLADLQLFTVGWALALFTNQGGLLEHWAGVVMPGPFSCASWGGPCRRPCCWGWPGRSGTCHAKSCRSCLARLACRACWRTRSASSRCVSA